jgi:hypothetical protein
VPEEGAGGSNDGASWEGNGASRNRVLCTRGCSGRAATRSKGKWGDEEGEGGGGPAMARDSGGAGGSPAQGA